MCNLGKAIMHGLIDRDMTRKELAECLGYCYEMLCYIINGDRIPPKDFFNRLEATFKLNFVQKEHYFMKFVLDENRKLKTKYGIGG